MVQQPAKQVRHQAIHDILAVGSGSSQEDIRENLLSRGIEASQATLSRDLREIGAVKIPRENGKAVYRLHDISATELRQVAAYGASFEAIGNLLVIRTSSGVAPGLCVIIDNLALSEIAGTIAGDDTILAVLRNAGDAPQVIERIEHA